MSNSPGSSLVVAAMTVCSMSFAGCISHTTVYRDEPSPPQRVVVQKRKFYYYPSCQAYRDAQTNRWYWFEAGVWNVSTTPPKIVVIVREAPQVIMIDTDDPKYCHETIVKQYPPTVVNVAAPRTSLPARSNGLAKGHDKQNARAEAEASEPVDVVDETHESEGQIAPSQESDTPKHEDHGNGKDDEDGGRGNEKDKGKGKNDDQGKPEKKDDRSGKGKKKDS